MTRHLNSWKTIHHHPNDHYIIIKINIIIIIRMIIVISSSSYHKLIIITSTSSSSSSSYHHHHHDNNWLYNSNVEEFDFFISERAQQVEELLKIFPETAIKGIIVLSLAILEVFIATVVKPLVCRQIIEDATQLKWKKLKVFI